MTTAIRFSEAQIEALAKHLGECGTGSDITLHCGQATAAVQRGCSAAPVVEACSKGC